MKSFLTSLFWVVISLFVIVSFITWDITTLAHEDNIGGRIAFIGISLFFAVIAEVIKEDLK